MSIIPNTSHKQHVNLLSPTGNPSEVLGYLLVKFFSLVTLLTCGIKEYTDARNQK